MAPKKSSKKKKTLTEEEKKARAEFMALQAEERRKKRIQDCRAAIRQTMIDEERRSKISMMQIHEEWRKIMRTAKIADMRKDIEWLSKKHVHQVELKDHVISTYRKQLDESAGQHCRAQIMHISMLDALMDVHYLRTMKMEEEFQEHLKQLEDSFMTERAFMTKTHDEQRKEMTDMLAAMKAEFEEIINENRQEFEAAREELKNKNTEEYNMMRISLESGIEELERRIEHTHQTFLASTEAKTASFKSLVAKDAITAHIIEQRMRKLIRLHETLAYWHVRIATNSKEWEIVNKQMKDEKEHLNNHYIYLKRQLDQKHHSEHHHLKEISKHVLEAKNTLMDKLVAAQRVQLLAKNIGKLETEHEKIFPFDPLYCSTIPTVPCSKLEEELAAEVDSLTDDNKEQVGIESEMGLTIPMPSQFPPELEVSSKKQFRWASYAVNDIGNEVEEIDYMTNFNKRFNKAMLDKLAIEIERNKLSDENTMLSTSLCKYLDSLTIPEHLKTQLNILVSIKKKLNSPRASRPPVYGPPPTKKKPPAQE